MQISGKQALTARRELVWQDLMDPGVLGRAIPGCKSLDQRSEGSFEAEFELGIAAVKGRYKGTIEVLDREPPSRYTLAIKASGSPGFVEAKIVFTLDEQEGGGTQLSYAGDAEVGGMIAGVGQRVVGGVAKLIAKQFFDALKREITSHNG